MVKRQKRKYIEKQADDDLSGDRNVCRNLR